MPFKKSCHLPRLYGYFRTSLSIDDSKVSKALLKQINLKGVKKISFSFNPLLEKTHSVRCLCTVLSEPRWRASNSSLSTKINVLSENRPPEVEVSYSNGNILVVKTENLSLRELIEVIILHSDMNAAE